MAKLQAKSAVRKVAPKIGRRGRVPYYNQTTDFTCGPSSLLMAMKALNPKTDVSRMHELLLWREANTIFMGTDGPAGCGATGLALAAHRRGFDVEVWVNHKNTLLGSRAKTRDRAKVMGLLQQADLAEMKRLKIPYRIGARSIDQLRADIEGGALPVVLVSMNYIHQDATAHWVVVTGIDDENVTVNDPWISRNLGNTRRTMQDYVVPRDAFHAMTAYGPKKERAIVLLRRR
ncbi:peptidase C39 family protein [Dongia deserti]|uniref:peptidase C39 family protein n=1 Tax=Dongia deserti TaxID=2268030 RepID=UPI0013C4BC0C|nr:peptidase C39 family protein [Dongia deserti]